MIKKYSYTKLTLLNKFLRLLWNFVWIFLYRPTPRAFHAWRRLLLRLFGARLGNGVHIYPSSKVWAPWNLTMDDNSCLSESVDCYCVESIRIGKRSTVSQYSFLCTASHDFTDYLMPLITSPINIGDDVWITADVFISPGIDIGNGAVILARSTVINDVQPGMVVGGSPASVIKKRFYKAMNELDNKD